MSVDALEETWLYDIAFQKVLDVAEVEFIGWLELM